MEDIELKKKLLEELMDMMDESVSSKLASKRNPPDIEAIVVAKEKMGESDALAEEDCEAPAEDRSDRTVSEARSKEDDKLDLEEDDQDSHFMKKIKALKRAKKELT